MRQETAPSLEPAKTQPLATAGEEITACIVVKFHKSLAEFVGLLLVEAPLWFGLYRNIVQSPVLELALEHEATDMQPDWIRIREMRIISIHLSFLNCHPYRKSHVRIEYIKLIELRSKKAFEFREVDSLLNRSLLKNMG